MFVAENKRRDALKAAKQIDDDDEFGYVEKVDEHGNHIKERVDKALLDLTDKENLSFRYVL